MREVVLGVFRFPELTFMIACRIVYGMEPFWHNPCHAEFILVNIKMYSYFLSFRYSDVTMNAVAPQITGISIVCPTVCSDVHQRKYQSSASLAFVWEIHQWRADSSNKEPVTRKRFPFDDVIMSRHRDEIGSWVSAWWKTRGRLSYTANIMAADGLATQGARASTALVLTSFS